MSPRNEAARALRIMTWAKARFTAGASSFRSGARRNKSDSPKILIWGRATESQPNKKRLFHERVLVLNANPFSRSPHLYVRLSTFSLTPIPTPRIGMDFRATSPSKRDKFGSTKIIQFTCASSGQLTQTAGMRRKLKPEA
jgi:hypothetical protein